MILRSRPKPRVTEKITKVRAQTQHFELRVCINKTCKRQGSEQIRQFASDLALEEVEVTSSGCLGNCGSGPNAYLYSAEDEIPIFMTHLSTPARLADALQGATKVIIDKTVLKATELRLAGNMAAREGNHAKAIKLYTEGIHLKPQQGLHLLYSNRSGAHLASGNADEACRDAQKALDIAPLHFTTASIRLADALYALKRVDAALDAIERAADRFPEFKKSKDYKQLTGTLRKELV